MNLIEENNQLIHQGLLETKENKTSKEGWISETKDWLLERGYSFEKEQIDFYLTNRLAQEKQNETKSN